MVGFISDSVDYIGVIIEPLGEAGEFPRVVFLDDFLFGFDALLPHHVNKRDVTIVSMQEEKSTNVKFSARLQTAAAEKKLDQASLARVTGITHAAINNYWNKGRVPKSEELHRLSCALGTTMEWLLTGQGVNLGDAIHEWKHRALSAEQKIEAMKSGLQGWLKQKRWRNLQRSTKASQDSSVRHWKRREADG